MRLRAIAWAALLGTQACSSSAKGGRGAASCADAQDEFPRPERPNVSGARELDQQGVSSFREGRYGDAVRYFRAASRLGGPSSELWNVARSYEKIDDAERADLAITEYLSRRDLSPQDRGDAEREARALRARPSLLTVTTNPPGALVTLDGKPGQGPTPLSVSVTAGAHTIAMKREAYAAVTKTFEARLGRAVIVVLDLAPAGK